MPQVFPFRAVQFATRPDQSALVAPPYDVLDAAGKHRLLARHPRNIVAIDLPHTPAKELGPPSAYEAAAAQYRVWIHDGTLKQLETPAMFAYRQTTRTPDGRPLRFNRASPELPGLVACGRNLADPIAAYLALPPLT